MLEMVLEKGPWGSGFGLRLRRPVGLGRLQPLGGQLGGRSGSIGRSRVIGSLACEPCS